jgi:hypothetical protein
MFFKIIFEIRKTIDISFKTVSVRTSSSTPQATTCTAWLVSDGHRAACSDSAVATTSFRQLGRCWKSPFGGIHFHSMRPTSSGSYTTACGSHRRSSSASVVLPAPNAPLIQMITGPS